MSLVPIAGIIGPARAAGEGAAAFNVIGIEHAEAIATGAERAGQPVILQLSENCIDYHGALEPVARAMMSIAAAAAVPVAVHLDHATRGQLVREAVGLGFGSVMYDASALPRTSGRPPRSRPGAMTRASGRGGAGRGRRQGRGA